MVATKESIQQSAQAAAVFMGTKLGLFPAGSTSEIGFRSDGDQVMIADSFGVRVGEISERYGEMRSYRYEDFYLKDELLFVRHYKALESGGFSAEPTHEKTFIEEGAILYV